jgi:hypothetical protein
MLLLILLMGLFIFMGASLVKKRPELFRIDLISQGMGIMGLLALGLVLLIGMGVLILGSS